MSEVVELLSDLQQRGIRLWVEGADLRYAAPDGVFDDALKSRVREHRDALLEKLGRSLPHKLADRPRQAGAPVPLSSSQRRLWFLERLSGGAYQCPGLIPLGSGLDILSIEQALSALIARHEVLRTRYPLVGAEPQQVVDEARPLKLRYFDLRSDTAPAVKGQEILDQFFAERFDLHSDSIIRACLLQLADDDMQLLISTHHIATDGWSMGIIARELRALLSDHALPPVARQYADFAIWEREALESHIIPRNLPYWITQLQGASMELAIPTDWPRPAIFATAGGLRTTVFGDQISARRIEQVARDIGATPYMFFMAAFQALLHRYTGANDICVGTPVANRGRREFQDTLGCFVNTVVVRGRPTTRKSFREFLEEIRDTTIEAFEHQSLPFEVLVEKLELARDTSRHPAFQTMLTLQTTEGAGNACLALAKGPLRIDKVGAKLDLNLSITAIDDRYYVECEYASALFRPETVSQLLDHFECLVGAAAGSLRPGAPDGPIGELEYFGERQLTWLRQVELGPRVEREAGETLVSLIQGQMLLNPDLIALRFQGQSVSFRALNAKVTSFSKRLRSLGVQPGSVCALMLDRSVELVVAILSVLNVGAAYVPLDVELPPARVRFMLEDAKACVLVTQASSAFKEASLPVETLLDTAEQDEQPSLAIDPTAYSPEPSDLSYVIYTSGSTGQPKAVANTHAGLFNRILWMQGLHAIGPGDVVLQKTNYAFDVSVWELLWPLAFGATMCIAEPGRHGDPLYLQEIIKQEQVSVIHFVPAMMAGFLPVADPQRLSSLAAVFASGEALPSELVDGFSSLGLRAKLHNLYGPTEASIDVSHWDCAGTPVRKDLVPIGRPIENLQLRIVDPEGERVAPGVFGELCILGAGLAVGYLGRPVLTAERYQPAPEMRGERLYRTGDSARWLPDGTIEIAGRLDTQVKLRGLRIELGELEAKLLNMTEVGQAVALVVPTPNGEQYLVSYVRAGADASLPSEDVLRERLRLELPQYMVPDRIVPLEALPLTSSGKVDRIKLTKRSLNFGQALAAVSPDGQTEQMLAEIWAQVLGLEHVPANHKFFDLGGTSLSMVAVQQRLLEKLGREVPLVALFTHPSIQSLARHLDGNETTGARAAEELAAGQEGAARLSRMRRRIQSEA